MKRFTYLLFAGLGLHQVQAQDATLHGTVSDGASKETLIGASVQYASNKGMVTDVDGAYTITLPSGEYEISVNMIGYLSRSEKVILKDGEDRTLDIKLTVSTAQLDQVVVSAGRFEQRVGEVTQSLSVLNAEIVQNKNITSMSDALDQVPGVVVVDEDPQIRAGSGFSYGAGSRVQVLVDDIPILSGDIGRPNWTFLPLENLEQVEVIKGASSVLYGSAALSGVINVRTAFPRQEPKTRVVAFTGMYDTPGNPQAKWWGDNNPTISGVNFFHSRMIGNLDLVVGGNALSDAGFVGPEPISPDTLAIDPLRTGPGGYDKRVRFNTGMRWRNKKVKGLNYGINTNAMESRSTSVFIWDDVEEGQYRPEPNTVTVTQGTQFYIDPFMNYFSNAGTRHSIRTRWHRQIFQNSGGQSNRNDVLHAEYQIQQKLQLFGETVITGGLVMRSVKSDAELYKLTETSSGLNTAENLAGFVQVDKKLFKKIALSAGVRYEQFTVNDEVAARPVLRAGATYQIHKATYLRASYGEGFRFPTIGERFINTSVGQLVIYPNADLRPEESWNVEGGLKQGFKIGNFMGYVDAVYFQQTFTDYVEFTFGQWTPFVSFSNPGFGFKSVNTGGAKVTGYEFELGGKGKIGGVDIGVLAGYTHTTPISTTPDQVYSRSAGLGALPYSYNTTSSNTDDNILKFRVRDMFRSDIQLTYHKVFCGFSVRYNSHVRNIDKVFIDLDESANAALALHTGVSSWMQTHTTGTTLVDVRAGVDLTKEVRLSVIVNNLTNEVYALRPLAIEAPRTFQVQMTFEL